MKPLLLTIYQITKIEEQSWDFIFHKEKIQNISGVNGGFISNPNIKLGVNCYGKKPNIKPIDKINMDLKRIIPTSEIDDTIINDLPISDKLEGVDISPFNKNIWEM